MKSKVTFAIFLLLAFAATAFSQTPGTVRFPTNLDTSVSLLEVQDRASTTLNGAITSGATTITVVSTSLFPATGTLTIDDERLYYTAKTATTFTVVRGQFSSTAAAHSNGAAVRMNVMAIHHTAVRDSLIAVQTKLGYSSSTPTTVGHVLTVTASGQTAYQAPSVASILPVVDTQTIIKGSVDATKLVRFEVDGLTTGTTRVVTVPDADITMVGLAATQSLTSKTLAGATNTITPIDTNFTITGSADLTKIVRFEVDGLTTATTRVATMPDANIVIAGSASALTSGRVPFATTSGLLTDSANWTYTISVSPNLLLQSANASHIAAVFRGASSQSANLLEFQSSATSTLAKIDSGGRITVSPVSNTNAFVDVNAVGTATAAFNFSTGGGTGFFRQENDGTLTFRQNSGSDGMYFDFVERLYWRDTNASFQRKLYLTGTRLSYQSGQIIGWTDSATDAGSGATVDVGIVRNAAGVLEINNGSAGTYRDLLLRNLTLTDAGNIAVGTTTGTKIGTSTSQKLSLWNATPIVQPSSTGQTSGFTAGAGTPVVDASTFTGGVGSTAYTIGDIVRHLKNFGLIAQ